MNTITITEFEEAMKICGAQRLNDEIGSSYKIPVPAFNYAGVKFVHTGSSSVDQYGIPEEILNRSMAALGESKPGKEHFWFGCIRSLDGLLVVLTMLDNTYTKKRFKELLDKIYFNLFNLINFNPIFPKTSIASLNELHEKLLIYDNTVNPFGNEKMKLKNPSEFLKDLYLSISHNISDKSGVGMRLTCKKVEENQCSFSISKDGWSYHSIIKLPEGNLYLVHYYDSSEKDELVSVSFRKIPDNFDLRISLKSGFAWKTLKDNSVSPVTDEQINDMMKFLQQSIDEVNSRIIKYMIK